jgi:hypothetical protein
MSVYPDLQPAPLAPSTEMSASRYVAVVDSDGVQDLTCLPTVPSDASDAKIGATVSSQTTSKCCSLPYKLITWACTLVSIALFIPGTIYLVRWNVQLARAICNNGAVAFPVTVGRLYSDYQQVIWEFRYPETTFNCTTMTLSDYPPVQFNIAHKVYNNDALDRCCTSPESDNTPISNKFFFGGILSLGMIIAACIPLSVAMIVHQWQKCKSRARDDTI